MTTMRNLVRRHAEEDAGFTLILVVGFSLVMMILVTVAFSITARTTDASRRHAAFDTSLDVAESGIDEGLGRLQANNAWSAGVPVPSTGFPACASPALTPEQCWAKTQLQTLAATSSNLQKTGEGQFVIYKPANRQTVYSMGWTPSYGATNAKWRMIKSEYLFGPYQPGNAILTGNSLNLSGSVSIDSLTGDGSGVHSNGDISSVTSDTLAGPLTASGTNDCAANATNSADCSTTGQNTPLQTVPTVSALQTYQDCMTGAGDCSTGPSLAANWYDLCPDGTVHAADTVTSTPCNGTVLEAAGAFTTFRGWSFGLNGSVPTWTMGQADSPYSGVYFVQWGDAVIGTSGNGTQPWNGTVIASANTSGVAPYGGVSPATCNKQGGNISWKLFDITAFLPGLIMLGDADVDDGANNQATGGAIIAGDQLHMSTSSATVTGSLVAADQCVGAPADQTKVQGITLHYDKTAQAPVRTVINTTLWLEYAG